MRKERKTRRIKTITDEINSNKVLLSVTCVAVFVILAVTFSMYRMFTT